MPKKVYHRLLPAVMPVLFFAFAATPVELLGCRTRGLIVLIIAFISGILALVTTFIGVKNKVSGNENHTLWLESTLILIIPVIALVFLA